MANKTIGQLNSMTPSSTTELAIYDGSSTGKATVSSLLDTENLVYADDAMSPGSTAELDFASEDTNLTPSSTTSVDLLQGTDGWSQRFVKVSQMFKNIRWILSKLGSTALGTTATTITGAIAEHEQDISGLNSNMNYKAGDTLNKRPFRAMGRSINSGMGIFCWIELPKPVIASNFNMTIESINSYFESGTSPTFNNTVSNKYISGNELQFVFNTSNTLLVGRIYLLEFTATITFV